MGEGAGAVRGPHSESTEPFEFRIITKTGEERWIGLSSQPVTDEDGTHLGHRMSNRDITSHMQTVQALRESEERLRLALNNARITIYAVDREKRFLWVENPDPACKAVHWQAGRRARCSRRRTSSR